MPENGQPCKDWTEEAVSCTLEFLPMTVSWALVKMKEDLELDDSGELD